MKDKYLRVVSNIVSYSRVDLLIRKGQQVARKYGVHTFIAALALAARGGLSTVVADSSVTVVAAQAVPGTYVLACLKDDVSGIGPCLTGNEIPVGVELVLKAHVEDSSGHPAQRGSVIFQDCLVKGFPAPSAACVSGSGSWSHIITMSVDINGNAEVDFGFVAHPRTIGFRFRYIGQRSGIANGESAPMDVTWF
jgi:hypothetical protein